MENTETTNGSRIFTATYHDTEDGRLARAGIVLRRRMENGKSVWELDVAAPAAEARLGDHRIPKRVGRPGPFETTRPGMRHAGTAKEPRREQLVVAAQERGWAIEDADALRLELRDAPDPVLDAVQVARDIEPVEGDVAGAQFEQCLARRNEMRASAGPASRGERDVRLRQLMSDDGELHGPESARPVRPRG